MNIKYVTYSRYSTSIPIYKLNQDTSNPTLLADGEKITNKTKSLKSKPADKHKFKTTYGVWYVFHDSNDISYALCTDQQYPETHAYAFLAKIQSKIQQINHCEYQTEENIKAYTKKYVNQLAIEYNDLSKIDKVHQAIADVRELENDLGDGIKKLINNGSALIEMEQKAQKMKSYANQYQINAQKLQRMLYWRNMKLKIIVGLSIIGLIGFIILIIVLKTKQNQQ